MWDYIAFFGYNFLFFLFGLFIWYVIPRPAPYDYTTIPGLKIDSNEPEDGNLPDMRQCKDLSSFLNGLHRDYGELLSFYWGRHYVVAVGSLRLWHDLIQWSQRLAAKVDVFPSFSDEDYLEDKLYESFPNGLQLNNSSSHWETAVNIVLNLISKDDNCISVNDNLVERIKQVYRNYERSLISHSLHQVVESLNLEEIFDELNNQILRLRMVILCHALQRCLSSEIIFKNVLQSQADIRFDATILSLSNWQENKTLRSMVLETLRFMAPIQYVFCSFSGEIDLDGHPIPAQTPIILNVRDILTQGGDGSKFLPDRFLEDSSKSKQLRECLLTLPYADLFASIITAIIRKPVLETN